MEEAMAELAVRQIYTTARVASYLSEKELCPRSASVSLLCGTA